MIALIYAAVAVTLAPVVVHLVVTILQPLVVALVTHVNAAAPVKILTNAAVSTLVGVVTAATNETGAATITGTALTAAAIGFVTSTVFYDTVWSRLDIASKLLPDRGLGATPGAA